MRAALTLVVSAVLFLGLGSAQSFPTVQYNCSAFNNDRVGCGLPGLCTYNTTDFSCNLSPCGQITNMTACGMNMNCQAMDAATGLTCIPRQCRTYTYPNCPAPCAMVNQECVAPTCSGLTDVTCANRPGCVWDTSRSACMNKICTGLNIFQCRDNAWCGWNATAATCNFIPCVQSYTASNCPTMLGCMANTTVNACLPRQCVGTSSAECPLRCRWDAVAKSCVSNETAAPTTTTTTTPAQNATTTTTQAQSTTTTTTVAPTTTTAQPSAVNCSQYSVGAIYCNNFAACFWIDGAVGTAGTCIDRPCRNFTAAGCPTPRCTNTSVSGVCLPPPCSTLNTREGCAARPGCSWNVDRSACLESLCDGLSQIACRDNAWCGWEGTAGLTPFCKPMNCSAFAATSGCFTGFGCALNQATMTCGPRPCQGTSSVECPLRCTWNVLGKNCSETSPSTTTTQAQSTTTTQAQSTTTTTQALSTTTTAVPQSTTAAPQGCASFNTSAQCINTADCAWTETLTSAGTVSGGICAPKPCRNYQSSNCPIRCYNSTLGCLPFPCTQSDTESLCAARPGCVWNNDRFGCMPKICDGLNQGACVDNNWCSWTSSSATTAPTCRPVDCSTATLATCLGQFGCTYNQTTATCGPRPCVGTSGFECPLRCVWSVSTKSCIPPNQTLPTTLPPSTTAGPGDFTTSPAPISTTAAPTDCGKITSPNLCVASTICEWYIAATGEYCRRKEGCGLLNISMCRLYSSACTWDATTNGCKPAPPPANTTNAPAPIQCDTVAIANCTLYAHCGIQNFTSSTGAVVTKCGLRACFTYGATNCPARCFLDTQAQRCLPTPCWNFTSSDACQANGAGACFWLENSNRSGCFPRSCNDLTYDQRACQNSPRCAWDPLAQKCSALPCNGDVCFSEFCSVTYSATTAGSLTKACAPKKCSEYRAFTCPPDTCALNDNFQCVEAPCKQLGAVNCMARANCIWQYSSRSSTSPTSELGSGFCAPKPCPLYRDMLSCYLNRCSWDSTQGTCGWLPCYFFQPPNFTASDCDAYPTCRSNPNAVSASLSCVPRGCDGRNSADTCVAPCRWDFSTAKCTAVPCSNYTQASCPQGQCIWSDGAQLCVRADCSFANSTSACANMPGCAWADLLASCVDADLPKKAPCRAATTAEMCRYFPQPSGRCTWYNTNSTTTAAGANTVSGYCTISSAIVQQCYEFPPGSACPSYCVSKYDLCINPLCYQLTDNVTCKMNMCRWNGGSCEDPRASLFPCIAYTGTNACPARCLLNGTQCQDYPSTTPAPVPTSCGDINDVAICTKVDACWFNQTSGRCQRKPCSQYDVCPTTCRAFNGACLDPCPDGRVFCPLLGICAANKDACLACSSNMAQCWDGSCKSVSSDCPCPPERKFRCPNGACVENSTRCEISCPAGAVRCWNNECAESSDACPCPVTRGVKCNVSGKVFCTTDSSQCVQQCTSVSPFRCWDGSCALNNVSCPCSPQRPFRCETNFQCYSTRAECPCRQPTAPTGGAVTQVVLVRCPNDLSCRLSLDDCNATKAPVTPVPTRACSGTTAFQCPDGSCAANRWLCGTNCSDALSSQPTLALLSTGATFPTWLWFRLRANLSYVVCGVDRAASLTVTWTAYLPSTGAAVTVGTTSQLVGTSLAIPPNTFKAGVLVAFVAVVKVPGTDFAASATVMLTGVAPVPKLLMPTEQVASAGAVTLAVQVNDEGATASDRNSFFWLCSLNDGLTNCADSVNSALALVTGNYVKLASAPEGNYTFTVFYKGLNASTKVWVKAVPLPVVQILQVVRTYYAGQPARFYAVVKHSLPTTLSWFVNGVLLTGATDSSVVVPASYFAAGSTVSVTAVASDAAGRSGKSSVSVTLADNVVGSCQISIVSDDVNGNIVALKTKVRLDSSFNATETLEYRFGYRDADQEVRLTPFWQNLPYLQFTAPVLTANAARQIQVVAGARKVGGEKIFTAVCTLTIVQAAATDLALAAQSKIDEIGAANSNRDTSTVVNAARDAATALTAVTDASVVRAAGAKLIDGLKQAATNASDSMSSSERSNTVVALQTAIKAQEVNQSQVRDFVKENSDKILNVVRAVLSGTGEAALDVAAAGNSTLDVLARTQANAAGNASTGSQVAAAVADLAKRAAQAAELGTQTVLKTDNITAQGAARAATDLGGRVFGGDKGGCQFPANFSIPGKNETSVAQIASAQYAVNPVGTTGAPAFSSLAANVAEYHVAVDGVAQTVLNQNPPLQISFKIDESVTLTVNTTFYCRYLDTVTGSWSSNGLTLDRVSIAERKVYCNTTHLSTFGAFSSNDASSTTASPSSGSAASTTTTTLVPGSTAAPGGTTGTTPTPGGTPAPNGATPPPTPGTNNGAAAPSDNSAAMTGAIVGGCIGGVVLIAVIGLVVIKSRSTATPEEDLGQPMNELLVPPPGVRATTELQRSGRNNNADDHML